MEARINQPNLFTPMPVVPVKVELPTSSPINKVRLTGQNKRMYDYLMIEGNYLHVFYSEKKRLKIGFLNSRASDLKKLKYKVSKDFIHVESDGEMVSVVKYYMNKQDIAFNKMPYEYRAYNLKREIK